MVLSATTCLEPTQLELWLSTDLPCDKLHGTAVTVGHLGELEDKPASMSSTFCERRPDGSSGLGMLVVVPSGERDGPLALKVVTAVDASSTDACGPSPDPLNAYRGCIVARRALRYLPHDTVRLTVPMLAECENVSCDARSTCFKAGLCLPADVTCTSRGCRFVGDEADVFPNPSGGAAGTSGAGGDPGGTGGRGGAGGQAGAGGVSVVNQIAAGTDHSCALVNGGDVRCWGRNDFGQLGDGTTTYRFTPVAMLASPGGPPLAGVQALALGGDHGCALLGGGDVRCWGRNDSGQLGDGTETDRPTPVAVLQAPGGPPLTGAQALALGDTHSCAWMSGGDVRCWGLNGSAQLGDGTSTERLTPVPVQFEPGVGGASP
ncbi:MAG TPA: hypothetical protein VFS43_17775 [Polyangiaceae bacterium]|nr:hypothetical protein [Polyangiaceae bacterium]